MSDSLGTVLVVDDDASVRNSLQDLLEAVGFGVRLYDSVPAFLASERPLGPSCLVLDVRFPGRGGLDLQDELARTGSQLPVIVVTGHGDIPMSVQAMKRGAIEFLTKPFREQDLLDAIHIGLERDRHRLEEEQQDAQLRQSLASLTARERQVMVLVAAGKLNKVIAAELQLSEITVKVHRGQMMRKMDARSVADLVRMVDRLGLPGDA